MSTTTHQCPASGCTRRVPFHILACGPHWRRVSRATQREVYALWDDGDSADYLDARQQAIREMDGVA